MCSCKERISNVQHSSFEISQLEKQNFLKIKIVKKAYMNYGILPNEQGSPRKKREKEAESLFKKLIAENAPNLEYTKLKGLQARSTQRRLLQDKL